MARGRRRSPSIRDAEVAGGGVTSSANDLAQWMRLQLASGMYDGEQVIAAEALDETHIPQIMRGASPLSGRPSFYALGWNYEVNPDGRQVVRHAGAFSYGARTDCLLLPDEGLGIVTLTAAFPTGTPDALNESFYDFVFHGEPRQDWFAIYNGAFQGIFDSFAGDQGRFAAPPARPRRPGQRGLRRHVRQRLHRRGRGGRNGGRPPDHHRPALGPGLAADPLGPRRLHLHRLQGAAGSPRRGPLHHRRRRRRHRALPGEHGRVGQGC